MQKTLRLWLSLILCGLSLLSSSGVSEALHENLHALLSSECVQETQVTTRDSQLAMAAAADVCPLRLILSSTLGQSLVLPVQIDTTPALIFATTSPVYRERVELASWNAHWAFSRGPPALT